MIGATLNGELKRTADLLVDISKDRGVYFVVAFLYDASYDLKRIGKLLPFLEKQPGARNKIMEVNKNGN